MKIEEIIGKTAVVDVIFENKDGEIVDRQDFAGMVVEISNKNGIVIANSALNKVISLPVNAADSFEPAKKGMKYRLPRTRVEVQDPDLFCKVTLIKE